MHYYSNIFLNKQDFSILYYSTIIVFCIVCWFWIASFFADGCSNIWVKNLTRFFSLYMRHTFKKNKTHGRIIFIASMTLLFQLVYIISYNIYLSTLSPIIVECARDYVLYILYLMPVAYLRSFVVSVLGRFIKSLSVAADSNGYVWGKYVTKWCQMSDQKRYLP